MLAVPVMEGQAGLWLALPVFFGLFVFVILAWRFHDKSREVEMLDLKRELHELESGAVQHDVPVAANPNSFAAWRHKQGGFILAFASGVATVGSAAKFFGVGNLSFGMEKSVNVLPALLILSALSLTVIVPVILALDDYMRRRKIPRGISDVGVGIALTSIVWAPLLLLIPVDGLDALLLALSMAIAGGVAGFQFWRREEFVVR